MIINKFWRFIWVLALVLGASTVSSVMASQVSVLASTTTSDVGVFLGPRNPGAEWGTDKWYFGTEGSGFVLVTEDDPAGGKADFRIGITNAVAGQTNQADLRSESFPLTYDAKSNSPITFSFKYKLPGKVKAGDNLQVYLRFFGKGDNNFIDQGIVEVGTATDDSEMKQYKTLTVTNIFAPKGTVAADVWVTANVFTPWTSGVAQFDDFSVQGPAPRAWVARVIKLGTVTLIITLAILVIASRRNLGKAGAKDRRPRLPKYFRRFFLFLEVMTALLAVLAIIFILCVSMFVIPQTSKHHNLKVGKTDLAADYSYGWDYNLGDIGLTPTNGPVTITTRDAKSDAVDLTNVRATVSLQHPSDDPALHNIVAWALLSFLFKLAQAFVILDLMRRLFRKVELGESFSAQSLGLVRKIGYAMILFSLLFTALDAWTGMLKTSYIDHHVKVNGMNFHVLHDDGWAVNLDLDRPNRGPDGDGYHLKFFFDVEELITALIVLACAEVFRQGLLLKKEHELTI